MTASNAPQDDIDHDIDALGLLCPLPVLKLRKRLSSLPGGALVRLRADDPAAIVDVPHYCAESGHTLLAAVEDGAAHHYYVRKT